MGSPLGPILADIFLGYMETFLLEHKECSPLHYFRFVDDTFAVFSSVDSIQPFLSILNSLHPNLNFTYELENSGTLSFLDVLVHKTKNGPPLTSIFRKPTWTGLYLHFLSSVPIQYKRNIVQNMFNRASKLCSPQFLAAEHSLLRNTFAANGYPAHFIDRHSQPRPVQDPVFGPEKKPSFLFLPFINDSFSSLLKRRIRSITAQTFPAADPKIIFAARKIGLRSLKDKVPLDRASNIIYEFVCSCGSSYLGRTSRVLSERMVEHLPLWLLSGKNQRPRSASEPPSAVTRHVISCPRFDRSRPRVDSFRVVTRSRCPAMLPLLEATHIVTNAPILCAQKEFIFSLSLPWK